MSASPCLALSRRLAAPRSIETSVDKGRLASTAMAARPPLQLSPRARKSLVASSETLAAADWAWLWAGKTTAAATRAAGKAYLVIRTL